VLAAWVAGSTLGTSVPSRAQAAAPLFQIERAHADYVPVVESRQPIFVLVIGSDARPDQAVESQRADSLHIVAINPAEGRATIVGIPRDSYVSIPDHGQDKINAALALGGPELVVRTVESLTGLTFDYWAMTGFAGFEEMIRGVGGLVVDVPFDVYDRYAHAQIDAGEQTLSSRAALAFSRARHVLPTGDFGRSENQGLLMVSALTQMRKEFRQDPSRLFVWLASFMLNAQTSVTLDELVDLAFTGTMINHNKVVNVVFPGGMGIVGGLSIVTLNQETVEAISNDLADDGVLKKANVPPSPNADLTAGA
jgi:LCP family protein required for cell wall assembly